MPVPAPRPSASMAVSPKVDLTSTVAGRSTAAICCGVMAPALPPPSVVGEAAGAALVGTAAVLVGGAAVLVAAAGKSTRETGVGAGGASPPQAVSASMSKTPH